MNDTIITSDGRTVPLDGLEAAARAATPGRWTVDELRPEVVRAQVNGNPHLKSALAYASFSLRPISEAEANARHIAAFDREVCLALVAEVRRLRERVAELEAGLRPFAGIGIPDNWPANRVLTWECSFDIKGNVYTHISYIGADGPGPTIGDYRRAAELLAKGEGLEFRSRTYDVEEPHREWYESRIAELEAENATLRTVLIKHQWADSDIRGRPQCPSCCGVAEGEGHYSDCEIVAAIRGTPKGGQQS